MTGRARKPLLEGESVVSVEQIAFESGVREDDVVALILSGDLLGGLFDSAGKPVGLLAEQPPSREALLKLGAQAEPSGAGPRDQDCGKRGEGWQMSW